ncbi:centrosome-associated protein 350-like [Hydractinia symbiolongicarpus]|uniref:centrosome-associated protein 350-like n=1 Tax=Hydractinia symbiolongicarpus TaxID=13093 RepID=UPI00254CA443|nr:centrosome-associated protein 350-like [Hydractinia symbiolongicarpus]
MSSSYFKARKVHDPSLYVHDGEYQNRYGSSLAALNDAWSSVTAAKKELTKVHTRIRQSVESPIYDPKNVQFTDFPPPPARKSKDNPHIERRLVYENPQEVRYRKENIPPLSYPEPSFKATEYLQKQKDLQINTLNKFIPTRKELYDVRKPDANFNAPDFNYNLDQFQPRDKSHINSSLLGRSLLSNQQKSHALVKLKEKINQQKLNSSVSSNDSIFPEKKNHTESDPVQRTDNAVNTQGHMHRKITTAPSAPTYKGFNEPDATITKAKTTHLVRKQRQIDAEGKGTKQKIQKRNDTKVKKHTKEKQSKTKSKTKRITASSKTASSTNPISTSSWRVGQEIRKKVLEDMKKSSKKIESEIECSPEASDQPVQNEAMSGGDNHDSVRVVSGTDKKENSKLNNDNTVEEDTDNELEEQFLDDPLVSDDVEQKNEEKFKESKDDDFAKLTKNKILPKSAKEVLQEMDMSSKESTHSPYSKKVVTAVIDTGLKKSQKIKLCKTSPPVKRKLEEDMYPKRKIRHYNQDEVKKYMAKQQKERKRKQLDEKYKQQILKDAQQKKLQELYDKQKQSVKESLDARKRHMYGDTFIKHRPTKKAVDAREMTKRPGVSKLQGNKFHEKELTPNEFFNDSLDEQKFAGLTEVVITGKNGLLSEDQVLDSESSGSALTTRRHPASMSGRSSSSYYELPHELSSGKFDSEYIQPPVGVNKSKADRVAAIRATAAALKQRLDMEAKRLSNLVHNKQEETRWAHPIIFDEENTNADTLGEIPGIRNIDEQASLNDKLKKMDEAAKKIQALYRGHTVRASKNWPLSSGKSLYQTLEEGRRRAFLADMKSELPVQLASQNYPSIAIGEKAVDYSSDSVSFSLEHSSKKIASTASLIDSALHNSNVLLSDAEKSVSNIRSKSSKRSSTFEDTSKDSFPTYGMEEIKSPQTKKYDGEKLRNILEKHKNTAADRYSVINIFARNYPNLHRQQHHKNVLNSTGTETEKILADAYEHEVRTSAEPSSLEESLSEPSYKDIFDSSKAAQPVPTVTTTTVAELPIVDKTPAQRMLMSPNFTRSGSDASEKLFSPCSPRQATLTPEKEPQATKESLKTPASVVYSFTESESSENSTLVSSAKHTPVSFSDIDHHALNPVLTSTKRSPTSHEKENQSETPLSHIEKTSATDKSNRMSPNTLERRLRAEINMFDAVGDSLQQLNEMERVRNIVQAQQETVSLAQVLKSRHLAHQQDLEKLSLDAKEKARTSAKEVETARLATAEASANAMKAIAEIKSKASEDVTTFAKQLTDTQQQATATTLEAVNRIENARQAAADAYKLAVDRQITDVEKVATAAATAASSTAVEVALQHHKLQLEKLRKSAFQKISRTYSSDFSRSKNTSNTLTSEVTKSSYSDDFEKDPGTSVKSSTETIPDEAPSSSGDSTTPRVASQKDSLNSPETYTETPKSSTPKNTENISISEASSSVKKKTATTEKISEDLSSEDKELSEALFNVEKKGSSVIVPEEESIHSIPEEEKFHSSFAEEELKHDFRMVLPSENHRRKSFGQKEYIISGCESSSDELLTPRTVSKWTKKRSSNSPFVDENTFANFTVDMVRQYVQEQEVRAKHQAALLELREKAIIEKTKAEMTFLEMQKKSLKNKGSDEKMPPITKKQRALLMKLQAEQNEIRRLKDAHKKASYERKALLHQEKEIQRIRESTQKIWNKMDNLDSSQQGTKLSVSGSVISVGTPRPDFKGETDDSISENFEAVVSDEISEEVPVATESISEAVSKHSSTKSKSSTTQSKKNDTSAVSPEDIPTEHTSSMYPTRGITSDASSVTQDLKKLKYMASKRYLTEREKKVQMRKQQFHEIIERRSKLKSWKQQIIDEEQKLKAQIKRVLKKGDDKLESSNQESEGDRTLTERSVLPKPSQKQGKKVSPREKNSETDTSVGEYASSIAEDYSSGKDSRDTSVVELISKPDSKSSSSHTKSASDASRGTSKIVKSSKVESGSKLPASSKVSPLSYEYSNDTFEETSKTPSKKKSSSTSRKERRRSDEDSFTEGTSDASDIEQRLKGLESELHKRKNELEHLRRKKEKENLRRKEQELRRELMAVEQQINRENKENVPENGARVQQPRVLSPRNSLDSIILPEKIKFPSEKESRRSLDFSDRESDNDRTLTDQTNVDVKLNRHITSKSDASGALLTKKDASEKAKDTSKFVSTTPEPVEEASLIIPPPKQIADEEGPSTASEKSTPISSISENAPTEKEETSKISIAEELSVKETVNKIVEDIYDDDFFDSNLSSKPKVRSTCLCDADDDGGVYEDDFEETDALSVKYSSPESLSESRKLGEYKRTENDQNDILNEVVSSRSIVEQISEVLDNLSEKSDSSLASKSSGGRSSFSKHSSKINGVLKTETKQVLPTEDESSIQTSLSTSKSSRRPTSNASDVPSQREIKTTVKPDKDQASSHSKSSSTSKATSTSSSAVIQPDAFSKSNASSAFGFHVNDRVLVEKTMPGTIRYLGKTSFSPVLVAGIELDKAMGTNNGTFQGKKYFECPEDFGLFTTIERIELEIGEEKATNKDDSTLSETSTVEDIEESLNHRTLTPEVDYDDDFEKSSRSASNKNEIKDEESFSKSSTSVKSSEKSSLKSSQSSSSVKLGVTDATSVKSEDVREAVQSASESIESFFRDKNLDINGHKLGLLDLELKSRSSSDVESLDGEIPSPEKLDLTPLADSITDSIMKSLLVESMKATVQTYSAQADTAKKQDILGMPEKMLETSEAYVTPKATEELNDVKTIEDEVQVQPTRVKDVVPTDELLKDAISVMLRVKNEKQEKLNQQENSESETTANEIARPREQNFLSLITDKDDVAQSPPELSHAKKKEDVDSKLLAEKLNQLKNVHDQLGALIGDDEDDMDDDEDDIDDELKFSPDEDFLLPPRGFETDIPALQIPFTEETTRQLTYNALDKLLKRESTFEATNDVVDFGDNENLDEASTQLYQELIFDVTKSLLYDIKDFRDLQLKRRPKWMKIPRKTFSKFTRRTHALSEEDLREVLANHVCSSLDLTSGRPSLEQLKRRLPLNLSKKDYVDAVLVDELREEEAQWVNYDEDELRVKYQLADSILDSLINETVQILSAILL